VDRAHRFGPMQPPKRLLGSRILGKGVPTVVLAASGRSASNRQALDLAKIPDLDWQLAAMTLLKRTCLGSRLSATCGGHRTLAARRALLVGLHLVLAGRKQLLRSTASAAPRSSLAYSLSSTMMPTDCWMSTSSGFSWLLRVLLLHPSSSSE